MTSTLFHMLLQIIYHWVGVAINILHVSQNALLERGHSVMLSSKNRKKIYKYCGVTKLNINSLSHAAAAHTVGRCGHQCTFCTYPRMYCSKRVKMPCHVQLIGQQRKGLKESHVDFILIVKKSRQKVV